jgi:hypothetical protein
MIDMNTSYKLPKFFDREVQPIIIDAHEAGSLQLPSFVKFNKFTQEFDFTPTQQDLLK